MPLPKDAASRKQFPMYEGLLKYFPDALAAVSHLSWVGNEQHNPGEPLHWAKEKSTDQPDCIIRHLVDALQAQDESEKEDALVAVAWRALALLQTHFDKKVERLVPRGPFVGDPYIAAPLFIDPLVTWLPTSVDVPVLRHQNINMSAGGDVAGAQPEGVK